MHDVKTEEPKEGLDLIALLDKENLFHKMEGITRFMIRGMGTIDANDLRTIADELDRRNPKPSHPTTEINIPSPVTRLTKGYGNQEKNGSHMVDLIDSVNGHVIAACVYEPYADEILSAVRCRPNSKQG